MANKGPEGDPLASLTDEERAARIESVRAYLMRKAYEPSPAPDLSNWVASFPPGTIEDDITLEMMRLGEYPDDDPPIAELFDENDPN